MESGEGWATTDDAGVARKISDKSRTFYVATYSRLGFHALMGLVEYTYFHPVKGPESNADFEVLLIKVEIGETPLPFVAFSVPERYEARVNDMARRVKLRAVSGVPGILASGHGEIKFPGADEAKAGRRNMYVIESEDKSIYQNDPIFNRQVRDRETQIVDLLMLRGPVMTPEQVADYLWRRS